MKPDDKAPLRTDEPWWWGVTNQLEPSAPWWRDGPLDLYYPHSSRSFVKGFIREGRADGTWTVWEEDGRISKQTRFKSGVVLETKTAEPWWEIVEDP